MQELSLPTTNEQVRVLEDAMRDAPQVDLAVQMLIHAGLCARSVFIPAGTVVTGALTKRDNTCIVVGDITATTDEGTVRLTGLNLLKATAGKKRAVYAHADTVWVAVHRTDLTTEEEVTSEFTDEPLQRDLIAAQAARELGAA